MSFYYATLIYVMMFLVNFIINRFLLRNLTMLLLYLNFYVLEKVWEDERVRFDHKELDILIKSLSCNYSYCYFFYLTIGQF